MTRLPARRIPPIGFAHRGASAHARENTLEAFLLARRLGASGIETDAWVTKDGVVVLHHDGEFGRLRKRRIKDCQRSELPEFIPTITDLYTTCGTDFELSVDVKDAEAAEGIVAVARTFGASHRLWLCHPDWRLVASWRRLDDRMRLVDSTRWRAIKEGGERRVAQLADAGIDALNMHVSDWNGGTVALAHRFELFALGWDAQHERQLTELVDMGIDGVFSDFTDLMMTVIDRFYPA